MKMKRMTVVGLWTMSLALALILGYGSRRASAQEGAGAAPAAGEKLPADIVPETRNRNPKVMRDDMMTDDDKTAYDLAVAKGNVAYSGWNGIRLQVPVVHTAYRVAIQTLDKENDSRYQSLAMLIGAREADDGYDFLNHEKLSVKNLPRETVEVLKYGKDTTGLDEKDAAMIQFGREMFEQRKVSSKTFADMQRLFGRRRTYSLVQSMIFFNGSGYLLHAYDQQMGPGDKNPLAGTPSPSSGGKGQ
jgi:hypothetical protein